MSHAIDWFTVFAQAVNFLILVWLLKRFLYKPILHAIDEREKGIAAQLAEAEAKKAEAQKERDDFQHKNETFDKERAALLKKATDEANAERQRLLDQARKDAEITCQTPGRVANRTTELESRNHPLDPKEVFAITRKTLADLAARASRNACAKYSSARACVDRCGQGTTGDRRQDAEPHGERAWRKSI